MFKKFADSVATIDVLSYFLFQNLRQHQGHTSKVRKKNILSFLLTLFSFSLLVNNIYHMLHEPNYVADS